MKHFFAITLLLCAGASADTGGRAKTDAKKVASAYFEALTSGDVKKADGLVAVPYSLDGKKILRTLDEVKEVHQTILRKKGKRDVPKYEAKVSEKKSPLDPKVFPKHVVVHINHELDDDVLEIYVTQGASPKIIGFRD